MTHTQIAPEEFKAIRRRLGLSQQEMADVVRIADNRSIRGYESGDRDISGPITLVLDYIMTYGFLTESHVKKSRARIKKLLDL